MLSYTMKSNRLVFGLIKLTNYLTNYEFELKGNLKEFKNNLELHYFIYVNTWPASPYGIIHVMQYNSTIERKKLIQKKYNKNGNLSI